MASEPAVTVILPVLNAMPYLTEALASLEAQTYRNFQVFVCDKGSTDGSLEELKKWIPGRLKGEVFCDPSLNLGQQLAALVERAPTELLARMDGDDICLPTRLSTQVEAIMAKPELAALGSHCQPIDANGKLYAFDYSLPQQARDILHTLLIRPGIVHPTVMLRRSCVLAVGNYALERAEDHDLWWRLIARYPIENLPDVLLRYRFHDKSFSQPDAVKRRFFEASTGALARYAIAGAGISADEMVQLRERTCRYSLPLLQKVLRHWQGFNHIPQAGIPTNILLQTFRQLTWIGDIRTRSWIASREKGLRGIVAEQGRFLADMCGALGRKLSKDR